MISEKDNLSVTVTTDNTTVYPQHEHSHWEIMCYLSGTGYMKTEKGNIPFSEGTVICMPPRLLHGSVSVSGFKNISLGCDYFSFPTSEPIVYSIAPEELRTLISMIYKFYYGDKDKYDSIIVNLLSVVNKFIITAILRLHLSQLIQWWNILIMI